MKFTSPIIAWVWLAIVGLSIGTAIALTPSEREVVQQAQAKITELREKSTVLQTRNDAALESLTLAAIQTSDLFTAAKAAQEQAAAMTAERDGLKDEVIVVTAKLTRVNAQYQRAQFIIAIVSAVAALLLTFMFTNSLQAPYNFIIPVAVGIAVFGGVYALI